MVKISIRANPQVKTTLLTATAANPTQLNPAPSHQPSAGSSSARSTRPKRPSLAPDPVTNSAAPSLLATSCLEQTGASPRIRSTNSACVPPQNLRKAPCPNSSSTISSFTDVRAKLSDLQRIEAVLEELEQPCCAAKGEAHCPMSQALQEAPRWSS